MSADFNYKIPFIQKKPGGIAFNIPITQPTNVDSSQTLHHGFAPPTNMSSTPAPRTYRPPQPTPQIPRQSTNHIQRSPQPILQPTNHIQQNPGLAFQSTNHFQQIPRPTTQFTNQIQQTPGQSPQTINNIQRTTQQRPYIQPIIADTVPQQRISRSQPMMLKSMKFDGTEKCEDWSAFLVKFEIFADASNWTDEERRNQLCWCLTGSASRYGTNLIRHNKEITFTELVSKMEQRFNHGNEAETLQVQFYNSRQSPRESTEEWADRLSALADKAFRDVPDNYITSQVIMKFLQALNDKEAGKAAAMLKPKTIDEAMQLVKLSQHLDTSIYGSKQKHQNQYRTQYEEEPTCQIVKQGQEVDKVEQHAHLEGKLTELLQNMTVLQDSVKEIKGQMKHLEQSQSQSSMSSSIQSQTQRRDSASGQVRNTFQCYNCNGYGHISRYCKKPRQNRGPRPTNTESTKKEPLNEKGSG